MIILKKNTKTAWYFEKYVCFNITQILKKKQQYLFSQTVNTYNVVWRRLNPIHILLWS